jgi:hypothetical protein
LRHTPHRLRELLLLDLDDAAERVAVLGRAAGRLEPRSVFGFGR